MNQKSKKRRIKMTAGDRVFVAINFTLLALLFVIMLYPMLFVLSASISSPSMVSAGKMILLPVGVNFDGYAQLKDYGEIWLGYANTFFYTVAGTCLNLAVTIPCAYALSRKDLAGRGVIMTFFIITMYFSGGMIPAYLNVRDLGLVNTRWIMLISGLVSVYNLIVSRTFFANTIPWELHEAATLDGCSDFRMFSQIVLPLSKPIIVVLMLYYGVGHWNTYFNAMIYLRDRSLFPLQLFLREILIQSKMVGNALAATVDAEDAAALLRQQDAANQMKYVLIVVSTLPMLVIYPWLQKYFAKGVMIGSVKG